MRSLSALILAATVVATSLPTDLTAQERRRGQRGARAEMNLAENGGQAKAASQALPEDWVNQFTWRSVGPANMGGRVTSISVNPKDHANYWVGTATGGVLRTDNYGTTYSHQFQHEATSSIGDIMVAPSNSEIVWVGTGESNPRNSVSWGNGVYKSENGGETWQHMGLEESFQIGAVEIHPENPDIVYVGALGRLWGPNDQRGLFKTVDGGENWERVLFVDEFTGVIDMRMNPADPEVLIVATYERERDEFDTNDPAKKWGKGSGLWKTSDGGKTWTRLTQGLPSVTLGRIGLDWSMSEENTLYAIVETEKITQIHENSAWMGVSGEDAEVGARLTDITADSPAEEAGLQVDDIVLSLGGVTVHSWNDLTAEIHKHLEGETVAVIASRNRKTVEVDLTFRRAPSESEDEGEPAAEEAKDEEKKADEGEGDKKEGDDKEADAEEEEEDKSPPPPGPFHIGLGGQRANIQEQQGPDGFQYGGLYRSEDAGDTWTRVNSLNPRPMYYSRVFVDPTDGKRIYILGTQLHRSKDRGETFTSDGHDGSVHVDHHAMWINPRDSRHIILGNDGGIYVTWDRMDNWDHHNYMALGQFYRITTDDTRDYRIYGGLQDNGSWGGPNRSGHDDGIVNSDWFMIGWGDGFVCRVDRENPNLVYGESQNGFIYRFNLETGEQGYIRARAPRGQQYRFNWNTPFLLSEHNHALFYSAGNHVFRSWNRGNRPEAISPQISRTDRGTATELAESPRDAKVLYVGTDDGALWITRNGGHTWDDLFLSAEEVAAQAEADAEAEEAAEEQEAAVDPANDPITGTWNGNASNADLPEGQGEVLMDLKLKADGKVGGSIRTDFGLSKITKGSFDAENKKLNFTFKSDDMTGVFDLTLAENKVSGTVDVGPGMITLDFSGERKQREKLKKKDAAKMVESKDRLIDVAPGRYHVSTIVASRFVDGRVYLALDGHRSNDDKPYLFVSEDYGNSWKPLHNSMPDSAGSLRVMVEDIENQNLLFAGTEFGSWVSIDRGQSWTRFNNNLPTVPVHDYKVHPLSGELIAGTHGRSAWVVDIYALRQMAAGDDREGSKLFEPNHVIQWKREAQRGPSGTRRFVGENPDSDAHIYYSLGRRQRTIKMTILDDSGEVIKTFEDVSGERGLHRIDWNLRADGQGNRRWAPRVQPGTYTVRLKVGDQVHTEKLELLRDPSLPDPRWNR